MAPLDDETVKEVIRQVEFYFSDSNLPRDKFMLKTISESDDGMVSLSLICSFSRMRGYLSLGEVKPEDVSEDTIQAVAETLRKSTFLKISEDGKKVGRVTELPKVGEVIKQLDERTIAASPLEYDVKLEHVESFFSQLAKVTSVRLPRHVADNRLFCGTALIEFSSVEEAANILKQTISYSGVELEMKAKNDFDAERAKEEEEVAKTRPQGGVNGKEKPNFEADYPKGLIVAFTLKRLSSEDGNDKQISDNPDASKKEDHVENAEKGEEEEGDTGANTEAEVQECEDTEKLGNGLGEERPNIAACRDNKDIILREDIRSIVQKFGIVKFIDFKIGDSSGYIRFEDVESAQKARAAAVLAENGGLVVKNFIAILDPLTGDAEKEYWNAMRSGHEKHRDFKSGRGGRGGKHNNRGGGRFSGRKHNRGRDNNQQRHGNKVQKVEAA